MIAVTKGGVIITAMVATVAAEAVSVVSALQNNVTVSLSDLFQVLGNVVIVVLAFANIKFQQRAQAKAFSEKQVADEARFTKLETVTQVKIDADAAALLLKPLETLIAERFDAWDNRMARTEEEIAALRKWRHDRDNDAFGRRLLAETDTREALLRRGAAARRDAPVDPRGEGGAG